MTVEAYSNIKTIKLQTGDVDLSLYVGSGSRYMYPECVKFVGSSYNAAIGPVKMGQELLLWTYRIIRR